MGRERENNNEHKKLTKESHLRLEKEACKLPTDELVPDGHAPLQAAYT